MSLLLRHPASVPALFSRAVEPEEAPERPAAPWRRVVRSAPLGLAALVVLTQVPLVKAAAAAVGLALAHR